MSRRGLIAQQLQDLLISTLLCESEEEEFDCNCGVEYNPALNNDGCKDDTVWTQITWEEASVGRQNKHNAMKDRYSSTNVIF